MLEMSIERVDVSPLLCSAIPMSLVMSDQDKVAPIVTVRWVCVIIDILSDLPNHPVGDSIDIRARSITQVHSVVRTLSPQIVLVESSTIMDNGTSHLD